MVPRRNLGGNSIYIICHGPLRLRRTSHGFAAKLVTGICTHIGTSSKYIYIIDQEEQ